MTPAEALDRISYLLDRMPAPARNARAFQRARAIATELGDERLRELALEWDCRFAVDTDAHAPGQMEWQVYGCEKAARHGIEPERIVNTWDADHLVSWAASHATQ